jgi:ATP-dependent DNA ligase
MPTLAEPIRLSETLEASPADLIHAVREQGLEGIVAKRLDSPYEPGRRSGAWVKMRVNKGQELVIGGYIPAGETFDAILVGYYEGMDLLYGGKVRNGIVPATREDCSSAFVDLSARPAHSETYLKASADDGVKD